MFKKLFPISSQMDLFCKILVRSNILESIKNSNIESLKKYDDNYFSERDYAFFSKALISKNRDVIKIIFEKTKNKEDLKIYFKKIEYVFDEEMKTLFNELFDESYELIKIKNQKFKNC